MIKTPSASAKVAQMLMQINAVALSPAKPFTWASGMLSPIYCDNRKILSYPRVRELVRDAFVERIRENFPDVEVIAGVATGGIGIGTLVAETLNLPFVYIRSSAKKHGMQNLIEGYLEPGQKTVVVEDLVSTGKSSLAAVNALREFGAEVMGMTAIFTYGFDQSKTAFQQAQCMLIPLTDFNQLIHEAQAQDTITTAELALLQKWRTNPNNWTV
jgi:orotate phosphoribosyltransferase